MTTTLLSASNGAAIADYQTSLGIEKQANR